MSEERLVEFGADGVVTNSFIADLASYHAADGLLAVASDAAEIGWVTKDSGQTFTRPAPSSADLVRYINAKADVVLTAGQVFNVAASGQPAVSVLADGTETTIGVLAAFALFGQASPSGTKAWTDNNEVVTTLTGTQCVTFLSLVGAWADDVYAAAGALRAKANATPPTITEADVDAFAWPTA